MPSSLRLAKDDRLDRGKTAGRCASVRALQNKWTGEPAVPHWPAQRPVYGLGITSNQARKISLRGILQLLSSVG
jgi:hypothetical protein